MLWSQHGSGCLPENILHSSQISQYSLPSIFLNRDKELHEHWKMHRHPVRKAYETFWSQVSKLSCFTSPARKVTAILAMTGCRQKLSESKCEGRLSSEMLQLRQSRLLESKLAKLASLHVYYKDAKRHIGSQDTRRELHVLLSEVVGAEGVKSWKKVAWLLRINQCDVKVTPESKRAILAVRTFHWANWVKLYSRPSPPHTTRQKVHVLQVKDSSRVYGIQAGGRLMLWEVHRYSHAPQLPTAKGPWKPEKSINAFQNVQRVSACFNLFTQTFFLQYIKCHVLILDVSPWYQNNLKFELNMCGGFHHQATAHQSPTGAVWHSGC